MWDRTAALVLCCLVLAWTASAWHQVYYKPPSDQRAQDEPFCAPWPREQRDSIEPRAVPVYNWTLDRPLQQAVDLYGAQPFVLRHTIVDLWPARRWSPNLFLSPRFFPGTSTQVRMLAPGVRTAVYADKSAPLGQQLPELMETIVSMPRSGRDLYERYDPARRASAGERQQAWYLSVALTGALLADCAPHADWMQVLRVPDDMQVSAAELTAERDVSRFLWVNDEGVDAGMHYDRSENVFVQLWGRKHFTLYAPEHWPEFDLYPDLHPHGRQVQRYPATQALALSAELGPGDVLYLPPYWFHHVRALTDAMSLNIWTDSLAAMRKDAWFGSHALPFDENWSDPVRMAALAWYARAAYARFGAAHDFETFAEYGLLRRYRAAMGDAPRAAPHASYCAADGEAAFSAAVNRTKLSEHAAQLGAHFAGLPASMRELAFADAVEKLALWCVGPDDVWAALLACMR